MTWCKCRRYWIRTICCPLDKYKIPNQEYGKSWSLFFKTKNKYFWRRLIYCGHLPAPTSTTPPATTTGGEAKSPRLSTDRRCRQDRGRGRQQDQGRWRGVSTYRVLRGVYLLRRVSGGITLVPTYVPVYGQRNFNFRRARALIFAITDFI